MGEKEVSYHKIADALSEEGIEAAIEANNSLGPYKGEHFGFATIELPDDPETLGILAAAILVEFCSGKYVGELIVPDRVVHMVENQGYALSVIEDQVTLPVAQENVTKPNGYSSFEDAMDTGKGLDSDQAHEHRNGKDLL